MEYDVLLFSFAGSIQARKSAGQDECKQRTATQISLKFLAQNCSDLHNGSGGDVGYGEAFILED